MTTVGNKLVTIFGGSGFLGRHVVRALARRGWRIRVAVRRPDLAFHLQPIGGAGQIMAVQANVRYPETITRAIEGADAVVNLVGILTEGGKQGFDSVQAGGARAIATAVKAAGITDFVHVSAIGADAGSAAAYARSKAAGEAAVKDLVPSAVIVRPSVMFGPEDNFFNKFGSIARLSPVLPVFAPATKFQPVFVGDVAEAIAIAVDGGATPGAVYELGGPEVRSMQQLMETVNHETQRDRPLWAMPMCFARLQAKIGSFLPNPPLTHDQIKLLQSDNVVSAAAVTEKRTLAGLGITPTSLAAILPTYLWRFRPHGQFDNPRTAG